MARSSFWTPFDPGQQTRGQLPEHTRRAFIQRTEAEAEAMRRRLSTEAGQRAYVEEQLARLPANLKPSARPPVADRLLWNLAPARQAVDECGYDLALVSAARLILLTHSNSRAGVWARTRITEGTIASMLELEALIRCEFELTEFIEGVIRENPPNFDSPT